MEVVLNYHFSFTGTNWKSKHHLHTWEYTQIYYLFFRSCTTWELTQGEDAYFFNKKIVSLLSQEDYVKGLIHDLWCGSDELMGIRWLARNPRMVVGY